MDDIEQIIFAHIIKKHAIAYFPGMKHINLDAERLYTCICGNEYQVWTETVEQAHAIERGEIEVCCPNCMRSTKEAIRISMHSGGYYNASFGGYKKS